MSKQFCVEFEKMESKPGTLDLALRIDTETGDYEFIIEESGLPVTVPYYQFVGLMQLLIGHATYRFYNGYPEEEAV